jgi:outer membrane biosynthesis protein TonB
MTRVALILLALGACRTRAVTTHYAGAPIAACAAGRAYAAPAPNAPTQEFIPLVAARAPDPTTVPVAEPPDTVDAAADPDDEANVDKKAKPKKAKKAKTKKVKKADKKESP